MYRFKLTKILNYSTNKYHDNTMEFYFTPKRQKEKYFVGGGLVKTSLQMINRVF